MAVVTNPDGGLNQIATEAPWQRSIYWLPITTPSENEQKAIILKAVYNGTQEWAALSATGDYTVDWGDGNIENFVSGVTAEHTYNYANVNLHDSSATLGYKQVIIQVYPQVGQNLISLNLHLRHSLATSSYCTGYLELKCSLPNLTQILLGLASNTAEAYNVYFNRLESVSLNLPSLDVGGGLLTSLRKLQKIERLNLGTPSNLYRCFYNTSSLKQPIPYINTSLCTTLNGFLRTCATNAVYWEIDFASCTDAFAAFGGNLNLSHFPSIKNTTNVTNWAYWFDTNRFSSIVAPSTHAGTVFDYFFNASKVKNPPLMSTVNATSIRGMFLFSCAETLPLYDFSKVTDATSAFQNSLITELPAYDFTSCNTFTSMLSGITTLRKTNIINAGAGTVFTNIVNGSGNLEYMILQGCRYTVSLASCKFSKSNLEAFITALGVAAPGTQTLTISGNPGTGAITSLSGSTTVANKVVSFANTTGIAVGDRMTGTGSPLTTPIAVTFQDIGDTVALINHQLPLNHPVAFVTVVTTTGIAVRTIYYVTNPLADTFQLSATVDGVALPLITNGTGTMIYDTVVESIEPNVSVTLTTPATSTSSKSFRALNTAPAVLHGFTISG